MSFTLLDFFYLLSSSRFTDFELPEPGNLPKLGRHRFARNRESTNRFPPLSSQQKKTRSSVAKVDFHLDAFLLKPVFRIRMCNPY